MDKFQDGKFGLEKVFQNCYNIRVRWTKVLSYFISGHVGMVDKADFKVFCDCQKLNVWENKLLQMKK